jgi:hypothetical protein
VMKRWSDEAMKRWSNEVMKRWSVEHFIASIFKYG